MAKGPVVNDVFEATQGEASTVRLMHPGSGVMAVIDREKWESWGRPAFVKLRIYAEAGHRSLYLSARAIPEVGFEMKCICGWNIIRELPEYAEQMMKAHLSLMESKP